MDTTLPFPCVRGHPLRWDAAAAPSQQTSCFLMDTLPTTAQMQTVDTECEATELDAEGNRLGGPRHFAAYATSKCGPRHCKHVYQRARVYTFVVKKVALPDS